MTEFEKDVQINPGALDVEWLRQASLFRKYAAASADAKDEVTRAKDHLEVVKAQQDSMIRGIPTDKKPTEAAIAGLVLQSQEYQDANEAYLKAKYNADMVQAAVSAMEHKKTALENLVRLMGQQYFAGPREPRDLEGEWSRQVQATDQSMGDAVDSRAKERMSREARRSRRS